MSLSRHLASYKFWVLEFVLESNTELSVISV